MHTIQLVTGLTSYSPFLMYIHTYIHLRDFTLNHKFVPDEPAMLFMNIKRENSSHTYLSLAPEIAC